MPRYKVSHYNGESGFLHSEHEVYSPDEETAAKDAQALVLSENGYGQSADGSMVTMAVPRFRVSVQEVKD